MRPPEAAPARYAAAFASGLIDPECETPVIVTSAAGREVARRYNIYRNNVTVSLIDALAAIYPAVQRITGEEFFRAMARFHVRATPPRSPLLFEYGRDFAAFIERYEHAKSMPWLASVARLERAWLDAYHAEDALPLPPNDLGAIPQERLANLVFVVHPAARILSSAFAAVTIFAANRRAEAVPRIDASTPEHALITRPDADVKVRNLPADVALFISHLMARRSLGEAVEATSRSYKAFNLSAGLAVMIEAGAFTSLIFGDGQ